MTCKPDESREPVPGDQQNDETAEPLAAKALTRVVTGDNDKQSEWEVAGDMAALARNALITIASGTDQEAKAAFERKVKALQQEIEGAAPTPLERLLAERIATCWLDLAYVDTLFAQRQTTASLVTKEYLQRRIDRAQVRYLAAIRTLAQVRRLLTPSTVQVNIAEKQVNIAQ